ncbi:calcium:cation antiporter [Myroides sp. LJL116]
MSNANIKKPLSLAQIIPAKTRMRLLAIWLTVALFMVFGNSLVNDTMSFTTAALGFAVLLTTIIVAAFGVVQQADELAHKLGEPYGTLILTLAIVSIEVILILAVMSGPGENPAIGKNSIFSVMMIIMNLVIGLCILLGGLKYGEQEYNSQGTMSYLAMIIMLGGIGMMLPNTIIGAAPGVFSNSQAIMFSCLIIVLYGFFLLLQIKEYRHLYVQPKQGFMEIPFTQRHTLITSDNTASQTSDNSIKEIWIRSIVLIAMILPIVLLSHFMAVVVDFGIHATKLPPFLGGVLIAIIVFIPESITAIKAALNNEFQRAVNLCHGAFVSTVGLTIPAVLIAGVMTSKIVMFGLNPTEIILFVITLLLSMLTFLGKRTTPIFGIMHLVLFSVFIILIFNP